MPRGGSRQGGDRGGGSAGEQQAGGWFPVDGATPRPHPKAGDLSNFGKIDGSGPVVVGHSVWSGKKDAEAMPETDSKPSQPLSTMTSVDLGTPKPRRRKLQLLPRSKPVEEESEINGGAADHSEDEAGDNTPLSVSKTEPDEIAEDIKKSFRAVHNIDESERHSTRPNLEHYYRLVDKTVFKPIGSGEAGGKLVAGSFTGAVEKKSRPISVFEEGFLPVAEPLDDITTDAPTQASTDHSRDDTPATSRFSFFHFFQSSRD